MSVARWLGTWFGCGLVPKAPGTAGSLGALPLYYLAIHFGGPWAHFIVMLLVCAVGVWASGAVADELGTKDPQIVVIDEVAGMLIALLPATPSIASVVVAFVLFRVFDAGKPWPVSALERLPRGWGIMMDDVGAGILSALVIMLLRYTGALS
ncbi:phosphatidylglycerophosphatase A [soil metagenome]